MSHNYVKLRLANLLLQQHMPLQVKNSQESENWPLFNGERLMSGSQYELRVALAKPSTPFC